MCADAVETRRDVVEARGLRTTLPGVVRSVSKVFLPSLLRQLTCSCAGRAFELRARALRVALAFTPIHARDARTIALADDVSLAAGPRRCASMMLGVKWWSHAAVRLSSCCELTND